MLGNILRRSNPQGYTKSTSDRLRENNDASCNSSIIEKVDRKDDSERENREIAYSIVIGGKCVSGPKFWPRKSLLILLFFLLPTNEKKIDCYVNEKKKKLFLLLLRNLYSTTAKCHLLFTMM